MTKKSPSRKEPSAMNNSEKDPLLLDHEVDGIQELDNNLPRWWVWLFYITIGFAAFYMTYYHLLKAGDLQVAEYDKERAIGEKLKTEAIGKFEAKLASLTPSK